MFLDSVFCCFNFRNIWVDIINAFVDQIVEESTGLCSLFKEKLKFIVIETGSCFLGHSMPHELIGLLCGPCMFSEHVTLFGITQIHDKLIRDLKKKKDKVLHTFLGPTGNV